MVNSDTIRLMIDGNIELFLVPASFHPKSVTNKIVDFHVDKNIPSW